MSFADEILRVMESAVARLLEAGIPGASIVGQLAGKVLPPPAVDADVPYAATEHTHPLSDLEQGGATLGQIVTWDGTAWTADDPAGGSLPLTTQGDLLTRDASANVRLGIGSGGTYLRSDGSDPSWQPIGAADLPLVDLGDNDFLFGALPVVNGGTGASTALAAMNNLAVTGTFTPTLVGGTTPGTFTYDTTNSKGRYTRLGNVMHISGRINITATSVSPSGVMSINGLPAAPGSGSSSGNILGLLTLAFTGVSFAAGYHTMHGLLAGTSSNMLLYKTGGNVAIARVQGSEFASATDLWFSGFYFVD